MEAVTFRGSRFSELVEQVKEAYGTEYRIIEQTERRLMPWFWMKECVLRIQPEVKNRMGSSVDTVLGMMDQADWKKNGIENVKGLMDQKNEKAWKEEVRQLEERVQQTEREATERLEQMKEEHKKEMSDKMETIMMQLVHTVQTKTGDLFRGSEEWLLYQKYEMLQRVGIKSEYAEKLLRNVQRQLEKEEWIEEEKVKDALKRALELEIKVTGGINFDANKVIAVVGQTGVGKTTTIAKIAGMLTLQGKNIGMITTDTFRIGAPEQLQIYADLLGVEMLKASSVEELEEALNDLHKQGVEHILIDTVGRSPLAHESIEEIKEYMRVASPDHVSLVLSSTMTTENMEKAIANFERVELSSLIFTKLDEVESHGILCNAVMGSKHKISYVTNGQLVPKDISRASSQFIANLILQGEREK